MSFKYDDFWHNVVMILYSKQDCPLCEDVEESLNQLNLTYDFIDIELDKKLTKRYHVRVPVLVNNSEQELSWPFTDDELMEFSNK